MNSSDLLSLLPLLLIAGTSILVMLAIAAWRKHWLTCALRSSEWRQHSDPCGLWHRWRLVG